VVLVLSVPGLKVSHYEIEDRHALPRMRQWSTNVKVFIAYTPAEYESNALLPLRGSCKNINCCHPPILQEPVPTEWHWPSIPAFKASNASEGNRHSSMFEIRRKKT
ncbi:unnamed protein product, partial [Ixodes persulcatus]